MTDKELLELAAKAAGIEITLHPNRKHCADYIFLANGCNWNPLADDGDALRLAVKLNLDIWQAAARSGFNSVEAVSNDHETTDLMVWATEERGEDPYAATRRAIVRAAADIGETL